MMILRKSLYAIAALLALAPALASAQTYPSRPIKLIVPFTAGTGSDILGRFLAHKLGEQLGQSIVVDNRGGAGGLTGSDAVAKSAADGYTLGIATNATLITSPLLHPNPPYSTERDFVAIGGVARTPLVMVTAASANSPRTVAEAMAKAASGNENYSSAGAGTIGHLTAEVIVSKLGLKVRHIPYKGSGQSLTDVARGEILFATDTAVAVLPLVKGGKLRALAVTGEKRLASLPEVPTLKEAGVAVPDVKLYVWWGLVAPTGTPAPVVQRLSAALAKVLADPDSVARMQQMELETFSLSAEQLEGFIRAEYPFWKQFLRQANIRIE